MKRRSLLIAAALAVMSLAVSEAQAGIVVNTASGSIGPYTFTNTGISGGVATIIFAGEPNSQSLMNTVNGASVTPELATVDGPVTFTAKLTAPNTYSLALVPSTYVMTVGTTVGSQTMMAFNQITGVTVAALPAFFNASGNVTSLLANADPNFDFSKFGTPGGTINFTFTGTTFGGGISSFTQLFATVNSTITGTGSFSLSAVPEPASLALLGIGMTGFLAFRRFFKKTSVA